MGQKVHPYGFRLGYNKNWLSRWFSKKDYPEFVFEDNRGVVICSDVPIFIDIGRGHTLGISSETFDAHSHAEVKGMATKFDVDVGVWKRFTACVYHGEIQVSFSVLVNATVGLLSPRCIW